MHKPSLESQDDSLLVQGTLEGDPLCFEVLVERYQRRLFGLVRHYTRSAVEVEDIVQDTFLKAFSRLETFQQSSAFYTWLYRVAVNAATDWLKKKRQDRALQVEDLQRLPLADDCDTPDDNLGRKDLRGQIREAMGQLPEKFRTILVLRELEGMAYDEISNVLKISKGTVESRLFRARAKLKAELERRHLGA